MSGVCQKAAVKCGIRIRGQMRQEIELSGKNSKEYAVQILCAHPFHNKDHPNSVKYGDSSSVLWRCFFSEQMDDTAKQPASIC